MQRSDYLAFCVERKLAEAHGCRADDRIKRDARTAVAEVLDALRHNPAWFKGLGLVSDDDGSKEG